MHDRRYLVRVVLSLVGVLAAPFTGLAQSTSDSQGRNAARPIVRTATRTDVSAALRQMPQLPPTPAVVGEIFERPRKLLPNREGSIAPTAPDPILQAPTEGPAAPAVGTDFEGVNNVNGVLPPDTVGDVGPNHYVQMVNLSFAIYNRNGNKLLGPSNIKTLWQGFGGPCESRNDGDPVVLYDHLADRWMMSQFALPNFPNGPFYQCMAVSQGPDPTQSWYRYEFLISQTKLNDYPKFGLWPDGYYMSINQFTCNFVRCSWGGAGVVAFERDKMLLGQSARMVYFDLNSVDSNLGGFLPSDLDGPVPPAGAPNHFAQIDDNAWGYSPDQIQLWDFHVNWSNPTSSTFASLATLGTTPFDANLCNYARNCIPQRGTNVKVDAISDRLMYRLQYRNFGTHQTLMLNHSVDVSGSDRAGIRWYELRNTGGGWSINQESTFSPTADHRWMGSIAMNQQGDVGLGYSLSSSTIYPSIRATGRLASDAPNQMTQGEIAIRDGSGYQTHSTGRWGDYSALSVDPVDDCTFWYTQEYYQVAGSAPWQTRIGSFKLRDCGGGSGNVAPTASFTFSCTGLSCTFNGSGSSDSDGTIESYAWNFGDSSTGSGQTTSHTFASSGTYTVALTVTDNDGATGSQSQSVSVTAPASGIHVGDLDGSKSSQKSAWTAFVTIAVHNSSHAALSSSTVTGAWSIGGTSSCVTTVAGVCQVSKGSIPKKTGSVVFSVTNVTHAPDTYNAADNHDPDGDSNGTSITVTKP